MHAHWERKNFLLAIMDRRLSICWMSISGSTAVAVKCSTRPVCTRLASAGAPRCSRRYTFPEHGEKRGWLRLQGCRRSHPPSPCPDVARSIDTATW